SRPEAGETDSAMRSARLDPRREAFWRRHPVAFFDQVGDFVPVDRDVEPHTHPAVAADIRRHEEPIRAGAYQHLLPTGQSLAPHGRAAIDAVLHGKDLIPDAKRRAPHASALGGLGKREADGS